MAFRELARRCGSRAQMVLRSGRQHQTRFFSEPEYTGKTLSDKEKAAENIYIKKMEEEQKLKQAKKVAAEAAKGTETPSAQNPAQTADEGFRNTAVFAGLLAIVAGFWLWSSSSKKEEKEST